MPSDKTRRRRSIHAWPAVLLGAVCLAALTPAQALNIEFDYRYDTRGFFTDLATGAPIAERRAILELAASFYRGFSDSLSAITPAAGDSWSVRFTHPSLEGGIANQVTLADEVISAGTLRVFVGGSSSAPGVLGLAQTGDGLTATGSAAFVDAVTTRGQNNTSGAAATDYGPWGGMIWFNAAQDWYFGADASGLTPGRPDFLTTATHELGHILGFGEASSWLAQIDAQGRFTGAQSVAAFGGPVPLDQFGSHWATGTMSTYDGQPQTTLMDPSTVRGQRELPTVLDYAGYADIGWQVSAVPEPHGVVLFSCGILCVMWAARRRSA